MNELSLIRLPMILGAKLLSVAVRHVLNPLLRSGETCLMGFVPLNEPADVMADYKAFRSL